MNYLNAQDRWGRKWYDVVHVLYMHVFLCCGFSNVTRYMLRRSLAGAPMAVCMIHLILYVVGILMWFVVKNEPYLHVRSTKMNCSLRKIGILVISTCISWIVLFKGTVRTELSWNKHFQKNKNQYKKKKKNKSQFCYSPVSYTVLEVSFACSSTCTFANAQNYRYM